MYYVIKIKVDESTNIEIKKIIPVTISTHKRKRIFFQALEKMNTNIVA